MSANDLLTLDIGAVAHGGHCVARSEDGRVVFVRHALPGERVVARVTERKKSYLLADAVEILTAAPGRRPAPCPFAGPGACGGCDFQHADRETQLDLKTQVLREQLVRLGGFDPSVVADMTVEALPGGEGGWRTRVQYAVSETGRAGLRAHRSHEVVDIDRCMIATERIQAAPVLDEDWTDWGGVQVIDSDEPEVSVYAARAEQRSHGRRPHAEHVSGPSFITQHAVGHEFKLMADGFWQVHPEAAKAYTETVLDFLKPLEGESAWDLYGGAGLFAVALTDAVGPHGEVTLVEADTRGNAVNNLTTDHPNTGVVWDRVDKVVDLLPQPDLVVLDPPRTGAGADIVRGIVEANPRSVAYVACDPAALARDAKLFGELGWEMKRVRAFDAFPMTHHFETIALFEPR